MELFFSLLVIISTVIVPNARAQNNQLPPEVSEYIQERNTCEHFRGEPHEGNSDAQVERRKFIFESLEIYCAGTDRRLAALKNRYKDSDEVMRLLNVYEERIER